MTEEQQNRFETYRKLSSLTKSGYAGILPNGNIVDRRKFPDAIPMMENSMLGIPKPIELGK